MNNDNYWFVYIINTSCDKLYTGITVNVERRFKEHCDVYHGLGTKGAKFFRGHKPSEVVYLEKYNSRSDASKREYHIKSMNKRDKISLIGLIS
tara:strand:+ start:945 stop:1223 length:279 start_codon:yes stop_codon:yes gene_type:complete